MSQREKMLDLANELRRLSSMQLSNKVEMELWYKAANELKTKIESDPDWKEMIPHFFWHYISDADIRMKDPQYSEMQLKIWNKIITDLEEGKTPATE